MQSQILPIHYLSSAELVAHFNAFVVSCLGSSADIGISDVFPKRSFSLRLGRHYEISLHLIGLYKGLILQRIYHVEFRKLVVILLIPHSTTELTADKRWAELHSNTSG